jgi:hypothetical protein
MCRNPTIPDIESLREIFIGKKELLAVQWKLTDIRAAVWIQRGTRWTPSRTCFIENITTVKQKGKN